jgi:Spy/CpxP family protein refolding chaperone
MKLTKLSLLGGLALGVCLALAGTTFAQDQKEGGQKEGGKKRFPTAQEQLDRLTTELSLTDDQKPKVKAAIDEQRESMKGIRDLPQDERQEKFRTAHEAFSKKMKDILTPDQYEKFQKMPMNRGKKGGGEKKKKSDDNA